MINVLHSYFVLNIKSFIGFLVCIRTEFFNDANSLRFWEFGIDSTSCSYQQSVKSVLYFCSRCRCHLISPYRTGYTSDCWSQRRMPPMLQLISVPPIITPIKGFQSHICPVVFLSSQYFAQEQKLVNVCFRMKGPERVYYCCRWSFKSKIEERLYNLIFDLLQFFFSTCQEVP